MVHDCFLVHAEWGVLVLVQFSDLHFLLFLKNLVQKRRILNTGKNVSKSGNREHGVCVEVDHLLLRGLMVGVPGEKIRHKVKLTSLVINFKVERA